MDDRFFLRVVLAVILIVALFGIGVGVYNAGITQGLAASGRGIPSAAPVPGVTGPVTPYAYGPSFHPWGFGFGILGCIFPLLFFFLIFALFRGLFFWGGRGWRGRHHGWYGPNDVPPQVEEWHRRMHEKEQGQGGTPEEDK